MELSILLIIYNNQMSANQLLNPQCNRIDKETFKKITLTAIERIRQQYRSIIAHLEDKIHRKQMKIEELEEIIVEKQMTHLNVKEEMEKKIAHLQEKRQFEEEKYCNQLKEQGNQFGQIRIRLQEIISERQRQIMDLKKQINFDSHSVGYSTNRDKSTSKTYAFDLIEQFQSFPDSISRLIQSLQSQSIKSEQFNGDMTCIFISRDEMSVQKYTGINRTFLKKKIKDQQKRFRYTIIYKPDKK